MRPSAEDAAIKSFTPIKAHATRDPRFPPVRVDELLNLKYSVDVLSEPEPCTLEDLDPKTYSVIVEDESGFHRGLLLPDLAGIDTVNQQL